MKISVTVKLKSKQEKVEKVDTGYLVYVKVPPIENKANEAIIKLLAEHFNVSKSQVIILTGLTSKHKIIEIR
ncbi:MAG: DUF167 domain-containing protein [bacterium]|nr:DUF167 domain-containing protein [bacterium]